MILVTPKKVDRGNTMNAMIRAYDALRYAANEARAIGRIDEYVRLMIGAGKIAAQIRGK